MPLPDYLIIRKNDWYTSELRDHEYEDTWYWCAEQDFITRDIYESLQNHIRPMGATDMVHMRGNSHFANALQVLEQFSLIPLMEK